MDLNSAVRKAVLNSPEWGIAIITQDKTGSFNVMPIASYTGNENVIVKISSTDNFGNIDKNNDGNIEFIVNYFLDPSNYS